MYMYMYVYIYIYMSSESIYIRIDIYTDIDPLGFLPVKEAGTRCSFTSLSPPSWIHLLLESSKITHRHLVRGSSTTGGSRLSKCLCALPSLNVLYLLFSFRI